MLDKITVQDTTDHGKLTETLNSIIDRINQITYVLSIPLDSIKPVLDGKDDQIKNNQDLLKIKEDVLVDKDNLIKIIRDSLKTKEDELVELRKLKPRPV